MAWDTRRDNAQQRLQQQVRDRDQPPVLLLRERPIIATFQFDADRKVVAALATFKARHAGMPGPRMQRHILRQTTPTVDQQMRGHATRVNLSDVWMRRGIERIGEQLIDISTDNKNERATS